MKVFQLAVAIVICINGFGWGQDKADSLSSNLELNTALMQATFRISGPAAKEPGRVSFGTVFLMGIPVKNDPQSSYTILITAEHVLDDIAGDTATLTLRQKNSTGTY